MTVRLTVVLFGLMILGGAWLVSIDDSGSESSPSTGSAPVSPALEADGIPVMPELSGDQRAEAKRVVARDPYVRRLTGDVTFAVGRLIVWTRFNQELLGAAVDVKLAAPTDYPVMGWPRITNPEVLYEDDPALIETNVRPESEEIEASATAVERFTAFVDLEAGSVVWIAPMGRAISFEPLNPEQFPGPPSGD